MFPGYSAPCRHKKTDKMYLSIFPLSTLLKKLPFPRPEKCTKPKYHNERLVMEKAQLQKMTKRFWRGLSVGSTWRYITKVSWKHLTPITRPVHFKWKWRVTIGPRRRQTIFYKSATTKYITTILDSKRHGNADLWRNVLSLHPFFEISVIIISYYYNTWFGSDKNKVTLVFHNDCSEQYPCLPWKLQSQPGTNWWATLKCRHALRTSHSSLLAYICMWK